MRFSFVYMGLYAGMGVLSSACATSDIIKNNPTSSTTIALTATQDTESASIALNGYTSVTINGQTATNPPGQTYISPKTSNIRLFTGAPTSGALTLSNLTVNGFAAPTTSGLGGAIYSTSSSLTLRTGTGPVLFSNNSADDNSNTGWGHGGAIYANNLTLVASSTIPLAFEDNTVTGYGLGSSQGGAIYAINALSLTDVTFSRNMASVKSGHSDPGDRVAIRGGAVYLAHGTFTYTINSATANILNPKITSAPALGDNDIACYDSGSSFIKAGSGTLVLNTNNSGWLGSTAINAGTFTVGDTPGSKAIWGPTSGGGFTVNGSDNSHKATLGGYGTINADSLTFGANSIWNLCLGGLLNVNGNLTLTSGMTVQIDPETTRLLSSLSAVGYTFPADGCTVATYGALLSAGGSTATILTNLNAQLTGYNFQIPTGGKSLVLHQNPVQLGTITPVYPSISAALAAAPSGIDPRITLTSASDSETATSNLSGFLTVGITGMATGTTINPSPAASTFPLFTRTFTSGSGSLMISNLIISGFKSASSGGAIAVTNNAGSGKIIALNDTQFIANSTTSANGGGAVYLDGSAPGTTLNYEVSGVKTITLNSATSPTLGDNDIACTIASNSTFNKLGSGQLVLNTNNANWMGSTAINEGAFIIGDTITKAGAIWGATTGGGFTVNGSDSSRKATLGGYGTINADSLTFGANSIWRILVGGNAGSHGTLHVGSGGLTLTPGMQVQIVESGVTPYGIAYPIATCGNGVRCAGSTPIANMLAALNSQIRGYNLSLSPNGQNLVLQQNTVTLQDSSPAAAGVGTSYADIYSALAAADRASAPILFPRASVDTESASSNPSLFTGGVTITSSEISGTTISPATLGAFALFDSSTSADSTAQNLTLSNVTVQGFSGRDYPYQGGAITTCNDNPSTDKAVNLTASGSVNFSGNNASASGGGAIFANAVTISGSGGSVTFTDNAAVYGGAICTVDNSAHGTVNLNPSGPYVPVTFSGNTAGNLALIGGGAIYTGTLTAGGTSPLTFTGNTAASRGGAIYTVGQYNNDDLGNITGVVNLSCPTTFTQNSASQGGGAIYAQGNVELTDTQFTGNTASGGSASGGAVYVGGDFTYTITPTNTVTLNPTTLPPTLGDNDIACGGSTSTFNKLGLGTLVLNTNNSGWLGDTTITAGRLLIGDSSHNSAIWGPSSAARNIYIGYTYSRSADGTVTTNTPITTGTATLGGYGTINANNLTFNNVGSIWNLCLGGILNVNQTLTLKPNMTVQFGGTLPTTFPAVGYSLANYGHLSDGTTTATSGADLNAILAPLNTQLAQYSLMLTASSVGSGNITLTKLPSGLYLGSPLAQNILVNFEVPGFVNGRAITRNGEGLLVRYGPPRTSGTGPGVPYFDGGDQSYHGQILLNNHSNSSLSTAFNSTSDSIVRPLSWTGSTALPLGQYAWQLWKTTGYTDLLAKDGQSGRPNGGWVAQGLLDLTGPDLLNVTYQINPGEGHEP